VILLVLGFKSSGALANASASRCRHDGDRVRARDGGRAAAVEVAPGRHPRVLGSMLAIDLAFFASNAAKFLSGGWFPLLIGAGCFALLVTWKRGRMLLMRRT